MRLVNSNILSDTKGITPIDFGRTLIVSTEKKIDYQTVTAAGEITGAVSSDKVYKKVEAFFGGSNRVDSVDVVGETSSVLTDAAALKSFLDEVKANNTDVDTLFIMLDKFDSTLTPALCEWGVANDKFPVYTTTITEDIVTVTALAKSFNSEVIAFDGDENLDARVLGFMTTTVPGYLPWSWRELQGATVNPRLATDQQKLLAANINFINQERRGLNVLIPGKTTFGEFIKNEWGKANMNDDMHIAVCNLLKSNDPLAHPGADLSAASRIDQAIFSVIIDYAGSDRKFIATWSEEEVTAGKTTRRAGDPKGWARTKTEYMENDIKEGKFVVEWAAMPRGECLRGEIKGLLTFDINAITAGEE